VEVIFHPAVKRDMVEALKYYHEISSRLAEEFLAEVRSTIDQASENPLRFHLAERGFRRANLRRFSYHILYEVRANDLRVMHIRHNKRHPDYGMERT
jgi:plasmid stabilization system protein ParE